MKNYFSLSMIIIFTFGCNSGQKLTQSQAEYIRQKAIIQIVQKPKPKLQLRLSNDPSYIFLAPVMFFAYSVKDPEANTKLIGAYNSIDVNFYDYFYDLLKTKNSFFKYLSYNQTNSTHLLEINFENLELFEQIEFFPPNYKYSLLVRAEIKLVNIQSKNIELLSVCHINYPFDDNKIHTLSYLTEDNGVFLKNLIISYIDNCNDNIQKDEFVQ